MQKDGRFIKNNFNNSSVGERTAKPIVVYLNLFLYLCTRYTSKVWNKAARSLVF